MQLKDFVALTADPDIDAKISAHTAQVTALREAERIRDGSALLRLSVPAIPADVQPALDTTLDGVGADAEERLTRHLNAHRMAGEGQRWVAEGVAFDSEDSCPFCGRAGIDELPLIKAFRAVFSDAYDDLRNAIVNARESASSALGAPAQLSVTRAAAQNAANVEFWGQYCILEKDGLQTPDAIVRDMAAADEILARLLAEKAAAPLHAISERAEIQDARKSVATAADLAVAYNVAVDAANLLIAAKKEATAAGNLTQASAELSRLETVKRRQTPAVAADCNEHARLDSAKKLLDARRKVVRDDLGKHTAAVIVPYQNRINYFLRRFNAEFQITNTAHAYPSGIATAVYELTIDNMRVPLGDSKTPLDQGSFKNTLSAGDRTTLALAFFLANLEREPDLGERVVVFDDPFNSQDGFRRKQTVFEILAQTEKAAQLIVLSHDPLFLKSLWERCAPADRAAVQILYHPATGSKISPFDLDDACRGRAAAELDDLLTYRASGAGNPREVIKKLRIVLETHYRSSFPGCFGAADNCGVILSKIREGGDDHPATDHYEDLNRINDYTNDYHHGEDARGAAEPPLDATELLGFVGDTLRIANALPA